MKITMRQLSWLLALLALLLIQYRLWFDDSGLLASRVLQADIEATRQANQQQRRINQELLKDVQGLRGKGALIEEYAREDLGLIKADESFILILDEQP